MSLSAAAFLAGALFIALVVFSVLRRPAKEARTASTTLRGLPFSLGNDWSSEDALQWKKFRASPTGERLFNKARFMLFTHALESCAKPDNVAHSAGITSGMVEMLNWQASLSSDEMLSGLTADQVKTNHPAASEDDAQSAEIRSFS